MSNYVRVQDNDTHHKYSVLDGQVDTDVMTVLDEPATDAAGQPIPPEHAAPGKPDTVPYAKWLKADLEAEVAKRNDGIDPTAAGFLAVGGTGTVADLAAALDAADALA